MASESDLRRQLDQTFDAFRETLQQALEEEARRSIATYLDNLGARGDHLRVEDADVVVRITELKLASAPASRARAKLQRSAPATKQPSKRRGGRRPGTARETVLAVLANSREAISVDEIADRVRHAGTEVSKNNLHQLLRRLQLAGAVSREQRGMYRATSATQDVA